MELPDDFIPFLLRAKRATYAAGKGDSASSRPASHDLPYREGEYFYLDTYLGGMQFIGEEAVWWGGKPLWGMNYYGWMTVEVIPEGFSHFLKESLLRGSAQAPFRGPEFYSTGEFIYQCKWKGKLERFNGCEHILVEEDTIYELDFNGGVIL
jgi:hypothetical protein